MNQPENNTVNISGEQVARACQAGLKLLNDDERVDIPPSMALSGDLTILVGILGSLASGQAVLANPESLPQMPDAGNDGGGPSEE